jgi:hypothetical protein
MLVKQTGAARKGLQRFSYLAVASHRLEPETVRPSTGATYQRVRASIAESAPPSNPFLSRMQWIKRTAAGRAIWAAVRSRIRRAYP